MSTKPDGIEAVSNVRVAREFLKSPLKTGSIAASSPGLVNALVDEVDFENSRSIVELGPGTGVITEGLVKRLKQNTHFFALEVNPSFAHQTRVRCPGTLVEVGCATTLKHRLQGFGIDKTDSVVSALPWTLFDGETQDQLLNAIKQSLAPAGQFVFYTYKGNGFMPASRRLKRLLREHFSGVQCMRTVWKNFPPATVFSCHP